MVNNINRPPIGYIVEGDGEYNCYPSLFCRIVEIKTAQIPIVNAGGCGTIIRRIDEQLNDLLVSSKPLSIIITVDLEDVLQQKLANSLSDLTNRLQESINSWKVSANYNSRIKPLPTHIKTIIQIKKFESWLISDIEGLKNEGLIVKNKVSNIDNADIYPKPSEWIKTNLAIDVKKPKNAKKVISALRPDIMRIHSQSFNNFYEESKNAYNHWLNFVRY